MPTPASHHWLDTVGLLPLTIQAGLALVGVQEVVGRGSNRTIIGWRDTLNRAGIEISGFSDDDVPWCGLFAAIVAHRAGKTVVRNPLWARNWLKFGTPALVPSLGDVLVFSRGSGGHVGFYVAEDASAFHVLGGNQNNAVCITRIAKDRLLGARRPFYRRAPESVKPWVVKANGKLSSNEA